MPDTSKRYAIILPFHQGTLMAEADQVSIDRDFGNKPAITIAKGMAGMTKGAAEMKVSIRSAVPQAGVEWDAGSAGYGGDQQEFTMVRGGQSLTFKAWVTNDRTQHTANGQCEYSFDLIGTRAEWQPF